MSPARDAPPRPAQQWCGAAIQSWDRNVPPGDRLDLTSCPTTPSSFCIQTLSRVLTLTSDRLATCGSVSDNSYGSMTESWRHGPDVQEQVETSVKDALMPSLSLLLFIERELQSLNKPVVDNRLTTFAEVSFSPTYHTHTCPCVTTNILSLLPSRRVMIS